MALVDDLATNYLHDERTETVTHTAAADGSTVATTKAAREQLSFREMAGGPVGIESTDVVWVVWRSTVGKDVVRGDTITDSASAVWTVLSAVPWIYAGIIINYRCVCRKQVS
jgi:hypothetical protein